MSGVADKSESEAHAMTDVETWMGWVRSVLSSPTGGSVELIKSILDSLGISPIEMTQPTTTDGLTALTARLAKLMSVKPAAKPSPADVISQQLYRVLDSEARQMVAAKQGDSSDGGESKFGELVMGNAETFFAGLTSLIGPPNHLDLEGAVDKEHRSEVLFTTGNYNITTHPSQEHRLVFGAGDGAALKLAGIDGKAKTHHESARTKVTNIHARSVLHPAVPETREHTPLEDLLNDPQVSIRAMADKYRRMQQDLLVVVSAAASSSMAGEEQREVKEALRKATQQLKDLDALSAITADRLKEVGLSKLELGCLRMYTGEWLVS